LLVLEKNNTKQLPSTWINTTLDCIVSEEKNSLKRGPFGSTIKKEIFVPSGFKVYEQKNVIYNDFKLGSYFIEKEKFLELKDFEVNQGDILVSCSGTIGRVAVVPENIQKGIINQALLKITLEPNLVNTKYFLYLLGSDQIQSKILRDSRGSAMKNFASVKELKQIAFPIPPLKEQKRIVSKIDELFSLIDFVTNLISRIKNQIRYYQISLYDSVFSTLEKVPLRKICELVAGQHIVKSDYNLDMKGIPYLTGPNDFREKHPEISKWTEKPKAIAKKGDVLITVKGAGVGKVNVLDIDIACISRQLMAIRPIGYPSTFLYYYFKSKFHEFQKLAQSTTVPGISKDRILDYKAPLIESNEQQEIINKLENSQTILFNFKQNIEMLENYCSRMRSTILKQAFEGKLVPQDPNDEPASVLLEKIRKQTGMEIKSSIRNKPKRRKKNK